MGCSDQFKRMALERIPTYRYSCEIFMIIDEGADVGLLFIL